jgi:fatty-acyl-CoA synthase
MRLVNESGEDVANGAAGELLLRGPQMFGGYLHDSERTDEALAPGGWLRTGDLATRGDDGLYAICGRRKDMYISGGENVYPAEVESALAAHPAISEVVVVGIPHALWGEVGCAFILPRAGAEAPAPADVIDFAKKNLASYKVPKSVVIMPELPRLGSGKPDRRALAAQAPVAERTTASV